VENSGKPGVDGMPNEVKCISCFFLGYYRIEISRDGGVTYFHPETLPREGRNIIPRQDSSEYKSYISTLHARDEKTLCLAEGTNECGRRVSIEPNYDNLNAEEGGIFQFLLEAYRDRDCSRHLDYVEGVSYQDMVDLFEKKKLDKVTAELLKSQRQSQLSQLKSSFLEIKTNENPQSRGKLFEKWITKLLSIYDFEPGSDIQNTGEQIDFTFLWGNVFILGEARWRKEKVDEPQVRDFMGKLLDRPPFVIGLMVSLSGYTKPSLEWISKHSGERTILIITQDDLSQILNQTIELNEWLRQSLRDKLEHP
jgi:hypothetical protein